MSDFVRAFLFVFLAVLCVGAWASESTLSVVRTFSTDTPPANIAVSRSGRIFMSTHQAYGAEQKLLELLPDGGSRAYPDTQFSPPINAVLGVIVDEQDILWFLDTSWGEDGLGRVIGWDTKNEQLYKVFYVARPLVHKAYILNDMAVDRKNNMIYITETASDTTSALLVVDIDTGLIRRVLEGSKSTVAEDKKMLIDGQLVKMQGQEARVGVNPITIDVKNEWVYFAPMSAESIYRAKSADLANPKLSAKQLEKRVERYAAKPISDGITIDQAGNIYVSDLEKNAIGMIDAQRQYRVLFQDDNLLSWVEGFANAGKQGIYATSNKLHLSPAFNNAEPGPDTFYLLRFEPAAFAAFGR
ncbi:L-dopachrome tautomerase-related protein [Agaribacterium haliotis]|uniref:L-dopachrome tautomerase-related protein n=1 Tax=Agaribacterium haliotis TaxID=2013869 RepID=UPI000BB556D9|nr:L-dopachrome tautomerase-related protein [Agaribacterium haliotis]